MLPNKKFAKPLQASIAMVEVKEPESGLPILVKLANSVPPDNPLPCFPDIQCVLRGAYQLDPVAFAREFERFLDENFPRDQNSGLRDLLDQRSDHPLQTHEMYEFVRETREALRMLASGRQRSRFGLALHFPWHLIGAWKVDRLKICENCGTLFLADRGNKLTCKASCSNARRVREWRKNRSLYEQARKVKAARGSKTTQIRASKEKGGKNGTQKAR